MADFNSIKDPIIRMFAVDLDERFEAVGNLASYRFYSARRSLLSNPRAPSIEKDEATQVYYNSESTFREYRFTPTLEIDDAIGLMQAALSQLTEALDYFRTSRKHFQRFTSVDTDLSRARNDLYAIKGDIELLSSALIDKNDEARRIVYERVLGDKLNQLDAPYLFNVANEVIDLSPPPTAGPSDNAGESLALLIKEASDLSKHLVPTNIDRRIIAALDEYIGTLTEKVFSPIKADLYSNKLRAYLVEFKDELPGFAVAEISALLLSQEQVLRQFQVWRSFEADASQSSLSKDVLDQQKVILENISVQTRKTEGVASDQVLDAFDRLETTVEAVAKETSRLGVWRSIENFIKTNIKHIIELAKNPSNRTSVNEQRYIGYLERLIPYLKLYVAMNEKYAWLLPVIQWLEESVKIMKRP